MGNTNTNTYKNGAMTLTFGVFENGEEWMTSDYFDVDGVYENGFLPGVCNVGTWIPVNYKYWREA